MRILRFILCVIYLTLGYWVILILSLYLEFIWPFIIDSSSGVRVSSGAGYSYLKFSGIPGELIVVFVRGSADGMGFSSPHGVGMVGGGNAYILLVPVILFALVSVPILKRLLLGKFAVENNKKAEQSAAEKSPTR